MSIFTRAGLVLAALCALAACDDGAPDTAPDRARSKAADSAEAEVSDGDGQQAKSPTNAVGDDAGRGACDLTAKLDDKGLLGVVETKGDSGSATRTLTYGEHKVVVDDRRMITITGPGGLELVVDEKGDVVKASHNFKLVRGDDAAKVYVADRKEVVTLDIYDKTHVAHVEDDDDDDGPDDDDDGPDDDDDDGGKGKVTICHVPPGNPGNEHTIHVSASAVKAHMGHGDYPGACDGRNAGKGKGKGKNKGKNKKK